MNYAVNSLRAQMAQNGIDAVMIIDGMNRRYFSGFTGTAGTVLITKDDCIFMTDSRYTVQSKRQCPGYEIKELSGRDLLMFVDGYFKENSVKKIWVDENALTFAQYRSIVKACGDIEVSEGGKYFSEIRQTKTPEEVQVMKEAAQNAGIAFMKTLDMVKPGVTEIEVAKTFESHVIELGDELSFIIVASGENGACPHNVPSNRVIEDGDLVTVDFGVIHKGYNSDCTRTFAVGTKKPDDELIKIFDIVAEAQATAAKAVKAGAVCCELDKIARDIITNEGYGQYFGHSLGHSLGLDIHELPGLNKTNTQVLEPGMFVTVEPGIYIEGLGGVRIEDTLMVTEDGAENITADVSKSLYIKEF